MEAILETKAETLLQFIHGLRGSLQVTFEEGTCAAWLYTLLKPHVTRVLVCEPVCSDLMPIGLSKCEHGVSRGRVVHEERGAWSHVVFYVFV